MTTPQKAMNACLYMLGEGLAGGAVAVALEKAGVVLEDVVVKTDLSTTVTGQQYSSIVFVCSSDVSVDAKGLTAACKPLVPGGKVLLVQPSAQAPSKRALVMCGMTSVSIATLDIRGCAFALLQGIKPQVELGSKTSVAPSATGGAWKIDVAGAEDEDLIDDDDLLTEEDRKPVVPKTDSGCASSKSACANCSCGRAEAEAKGVKLQLTQDMIENPKSACGSCGLGDAFRCATCPYRGLPQFEEGKKIQLPANFLMADA